MTETMYYLLWLRCILTWLAFAWQIKLGLAIVEGAELFIPAQPRSEWYAEQAEWRR